MQRDLLLTESGDLTIIDNNLAFLEGRDIYIQAFRQLLQTRLGEYMLNAQEGFDMFSILGQKNIDDDIVNSALQRVGAQIRDYVEFTSISYEYNRQKRTLDIKFSALFADGYQQEYEIEVNLNG